MYSDLSYTFLSIIDNTMIKLFNILFSIHTKTNIFLTVFIILNHLHKN